MVRRASPACDPCRPDRVRSNLKNPQTTLARPLLTTTNHHQHIKTNPDPSQVYGSTASTSEREWGSPFLPDKTRVKTKQIPAQKQTKQPATQQIHLHRTLGVGGRPEREQTVLLSNGRTKMVQRCEASASRLLSLSLSLMGSEPSEKQNYTRREGQCDHQVDKPPQEGAAENHTLGQQKKSTPIKYHNSLLVAWVPVRTPQSWSSTLRAARVPVAPSPFE